MEYGNDFDFSYGVPDGPTMSSSGSDIFSVIMTVYLLVIVAAVMIGIVKYVLNPLHFTVWHREQEMQIRGWHGYRLRDLIFREILQAVCL